MKTLTLVQFALMKLKQSPEDFEVEELAEFPPGEPGEAGAWALYRLEKRVIGTPEAVRAIRQRWRIVPDRVRWAGLKDKHALTRQFLSIHRGPRRGLQQTGIVLKYLGQTAEPFSPAGIVGNRFRIVLRDLSAEDVARCERAAEEVRAAGIPNYFDDQRFGSVGTGGRFIARHLIDGDYESALKLALTEPYEFDSRAQKQQKQRLREHWGDWGRLATGQASRPAAGPIAHLRSNPTDYRGAIARLPEDLLSLYLAAYQSWLWNWMLARWMVEHVEGKQLVQVRLRLGEVPMPRELDGTTAARLRELAIPLPSGRLHLEDANPLRWLVEAVMQEEGLELRQMHLKHFRRPFFAKGDRPANFLPQSLEIAAMDDERHAGRRNLTLRFVLPRGSYATILIKRLMAGE